MFPLKKSGLPSPNEYNKFYFVHFSGFHNIHLLGSGTEKGTIGVSRFKWLFLVSLCYLSKIEPKVMFSWTRCFFEKKLCRPQIEIDNSHLGESSSKPLGNLIKFVQMQIPTKRLARWFLLWKIISLIFHSCGCGSF